MANSDTAGPVVQNAPMFAFTNLGENGMRPRGTGVGERLGIRPGAASLSGDVPEDAFRAPTVRAPRDRAKF